MIELFTAPTPNGHKVSIALEALGLAYKVTHIRLDQKTQKEPWFLKINPNGRIPAIIDAEENDFAVFESGAILVYLAEKVGSLLGSDRGERSKIMQWLMFQMGGVGPMQGQAHVFLHYAPEKIPFAQARYQNETMRLYRVLEEQLKNRTFLVDRFSIADIATYPWIRSHKWAGLSLESLPNLSRWCDAMAAMPVVQRGMDVPVPQDQLRERGPKAVEDVGRKII